MELFLLVALVSAVVCFLKGNLRAAYAVVGSGSALIAAIVVLEQGSDEVPAITSMLLTGGFVAWAVLAVVAASRPARPKSAWARRSAVDPAGRRILDQDPLAWRIVRSLFGAVAGTLPAIIFMSLVMALADTGDEAQVAFVGIPIALLGFLLGGWIGFNWVPRQKVEDRSTQSRRPARGQQTGDPRAA